MRMRMSVVDDGDHIWDEQCDLSVFAGCGVRVGSGEGQEEVAVTIPGVDSMSSIQQ